MKIQSSTKNGSNGIILNMGPAKTHGCMHPFHPFQFISYFTFGFYLYVFYFIDIIALLQYPVMILVFGILYTLNLPILITETLIATLSDPTDPTVYEEKTIELEQ